MVVLQKPRSGSNGIKVRDLGILAVGLALGVIVALLFEVGSSMDASVRCASDLLSITTSNSNAISTPSSQQHAAFVPPCMNPIYSYYGKLHHLTDGIPTTWWLETSNKHKQDKSGSWFSQHGQDVAVAKFFNFKRDGFFVDLAANDAVWASNTFSLEQNFGWKGICIEANPQYWYRLSFRNCHVVGGIVGGTNNEEVDVILGQAHHGPYGGIVGDDFDNKKISKKQQQQGDSSKRYTIALSTVLEMFNAPKVIDYLSLDVEGAELFIMKDFPFDKYTFKCMTVERPKDELKSLFEKNGYKHVLDFKRGDTLWAHESFYEEGKKLTAIHPDEIDQHKILHSQMPGFS